MALTSLDSLHGATVLRGNLSSLGRFHIELENGQRYLEAHLGEDRNSALVLPAGVLAYVIAGDREATIHADRPSILVDRLRFAARRTTERGSIDAAYRNGLFAAAFSSTYYRGYVDSLGVAGVDVAEAPDVRPRRDLSTRRKTGIGLLTSAGALAITSLVTGALAISAKHDFSSTVFQRTAYDADQRYRDFSWAAGLTGAASIALGIAGGVLTWK